MVALVVKMVMLMGVLVVKMVMLMLVMTMKLASMIKIVTLYHCQSIFTVQIFRYGFRDLIASPGGPCVSIAQV